MFEQRPSRLRDVSRLRSSPGLGTTIGAFVVERRLAQGEVSVLYVARDGQGARVVLKLVPPGVANSAGRARLAREARALASVAHPGIVRVRGTGEHEGMPWIATEYVQGTDLRHHLADRGPMHPDAAVRTAALLAEALAAAHQAGVVHRDLKPSSVLVTPDGRVVLVDFGISKRRAEPRESDVPLGEREALGAPAYLAPEQIEHGLADERSDIWALGCILFEMIAGAPPWGGGGPPTTASILRGDEPAIPAGIGSTGDINSACLRKSSFARVASARELAALLRSAVEVRRDPPDDPDRPLLQLARASTRASTRPEPPPAAHPPSKPPSVLAPGALVASAVGGRRRGRAWQRSPSSRPPPRSSSSIRAVAPHGRVKGAALRAALMWFTEAYGESACARAFQLASPDLQAVLRPADRAYGVMASSWYDAGLVGELVEIVEGVAAPDDVDEYRSRLAAAVARDNVGGVYRSLFRLVATPSLLEANAQRVWGTYVNEGAFVVRILRPGTFEARLRGWSAHHPALCRLGAPLLRGAS